MNPVHLHCVRVHVFFRDSLRFGLFQQRDSIGSTANNVWPSSCSMSTLSSPRVQHGNETISGKIHLRPHPDTLFLFCSFSRVCCYVPVFIYDHYCSVSVCLLFSPMSDLFPCPSTTVCSIPAWYKSTVVQQKRGSPVCPPSVCPGFNSYQWLAVFFLIVANFTVQFYATFTWMFMTLSAATKV